METTEQRQRPTVHVAVYDTLADWEIGYAIAHLRDTSYHRAPRTGFAVATVGPTTEPVTTMGGLRIVPDLAIGDLRPQDSALLILAGATAWDAGDANAPFARAARAFLDAGVPVAAICGATAGLAAEGLLDDRDHTSAAAGYLAATGYQGGDRYREAAAVTDRGLITAGPTEPIAFAREILAQLDVFEPEVLDAWYRLFAASDASAYEVLAAAAQR
ncbi:DJ-1/PfpI family protein [Streptomyces sp. XD-27]|uniref:DJ-1/PfpI family protein n=1 Tax=Streptomyces sp. XD-27 TaxID=3062779 RepID=UPI0026F4701E|nr:DJ-1/PfpI family protein [Streptomyces sp. XD-27]WKX74304.1 DJ-1/PfpI family protein [Streptomyces sp. XD-27]